MSVDCVSSVHTEHTVDSEPEDFMTDEKTPAANDILDRSDPHQDARTLVRLLQCSQCSHPYRTPITLPCGNSLCRQCLPTPHDRENISYPDIPSRQKSVTCPFSNCKQEHPLVDCSVDFVLLKICESIASAANVSRSGEKGASLLARESVEHDGARTTQHNAEMKAERARSRVLYGGRLMAAYTLAELGELDYSSGIDFQSIDESPFPETLDDDVFLNTLKTTVQDKVECQVCYGMLLQPATTHCGHSFCRKCLARILDHSRLCPHCRREISLPPHLVGHPNNTTIGSILTSLFPEELAVREDSMKLEENTAPGGLDTALFVCTVAYPSMPMILHVFEPRYRLMIRRALEGNRRFGMVAYKEHNHSGLVNSAPFLETGTMLQIEQCQIEPDGRSWLLCQGVYRFKVLAHGSLDGYTIGRVERHEDIPVASEERIEAEETSAPQSEERPRDISSMPTTELAAEGLAFLQRAQEQSARWLQGSIQNIYGAPPTDPALLPYWFASVVPLPETEKYKLLPTTSVRERLKIMVRWIRKVESQPWYSTNACVAL